MGVFQKLVMGARREVARRAEVCVLPNEGRVEIFKKQTGTDKPVECVWNVPGINEIGPKKKKPSERKTLRLFYGGTLSPKILPQLFLEEIIKNPNTEIEICGYETYSEKAYYKWLQQAAKFSKCIVLHGPKSHFKMLKIADQCDLGICLYDLNEKNINFQNIIGAANKPFDAMARGLAVVVSDLPEWRRIFLGIGDKEERNEEDPKFRIPEPGKGYGIAINPECRESIRAGLEWMLNNREMLWEMGERGKQKIQNEWNYERKFKQVFRRIEAN